MEALRHIRGARQILVDVMVRQPLAPSLLHHAGRAQGVLAEAERSKRRRYERLTRARGMEFVPFSLETTGAFGEDALRLIREIAGFAHATSPDLRRGAVLSSIVAAVSVAVQRGNALATSTGMQRSSSHLMGLDH